jgi:hypothetical protein
MQTRSNPTTQQLEILHPELQIWVQAIALLQVQDGLGTKLVSEQAEVLNQISTRTQSLISLDTKLASTLAEVQQLKSQLVEITSGTNHLGNLLSTAGFAVAEIKVLQSLLTSGSLLTKVIDIYEAISRQAATLTLLQSSVTAVTAELKKTTTTTPAIANLTLVEANTQYQYSFPAGTKRYAFKCRMDKARGDKAGDLRYSWVPDKVAPVGGGTGVDNYDVLAIGVEESDTTYFADGATLYFASDEPGAIVSIRRWS